MKSLLQQEDRPFCGYCDRRLLPRVGLWVSVSSIRLTPNRVGHVPSIKIRRFRPYAISLFPTITIRSQNIHTYHCAMYHCYSVYASSRFRRWCCPIECGDRENVRIQIGVDVRNFDACISTIAIQQNTNSIAEHFMRFDQRHNAKMDQAFETVVVEYKYLKEASFSIWLDISVIYSVRFYLHIVDLFMIIIYRIVAAKLQYHGLILDSVKLRELYRSLAHRRLVMSHRSISE